MAFQFFKGDLFECQKCNRKCKIKLRCPLLVEYGHKKYKKILENICIECFLIELKDINKNKRIHLNWL